MKPSAVSQTRLSLACLAVLTGLMTPEPALSQPAQVLAPARPQLTGTAFFRDTEQRAVINWYTDGSATLEYSDPWTSATISSVSVDRQGDRLRFRMDNGSTIVLTGWNFQGAAFTVLAPQATYLATIPYISHYDRTNSLELAATDRRPEPAEPPTPTVAVQPPAPPQAPIVPPAPKPEAPPPSSAVTSPLVPQPPTRPFGASPPPVPQPPEVAAPPPPVVVATATEAQHGQCRRIVGLALGALYTNIETQATAVEPSGLARIEWSNFPNRQRGYCYVNDQGQVVEMKVD